MSKYRVKVGNMYFVRFDDMTVVMVIDDAPGAVEQAKIFDRGTAAHLMSEQLGGRMIRVYEEEPAC